MQMFLLQWLRNSVKYPVLRTQAAVASKSAQEQENYSIFRPK